MTKFNEIDAKQTNFMHILHAAERTNEQSMGISLTHWAAGQFDTRRSSTTLRQRSSLSRTKLTAEIAYSEHNEHAEHAEHNIRIIFWLHIYVFYS